MDCEDSKRKLTSQEKERFIQNITPLICNLARKGFKTYRGVFQFRDEAKDEMLSAAYLGAAKAADLYVNGSTAKPATFAYKFIWREIMVAMIKLSSNGLTPKKRKKHESGRPLVFSASTITFGVEDSCSYDILCGEHGIEWALNLIEDKRDRMIVEMRLVHDLTYDEIANSIGVTKNRVRQLYIRAISNVKQDAISEFFGLKSERGRNKIG